MPPLASPPAALHLLIVEDQPLDAELMVQELQRAGFTFASVTRVQTADAFVSQLIRAPDVILCDYALPSFSAPDALRLVQQRNLDVPFIIISGSIGEEVAVEAIKSGADDYLLKDRLGRLGSAVTQALQEKRLRADAHRAEEDLRQSEYKYRCLFEHLPDAAFLCDASTGRIIDTNRRGESILELDRAAVLGMRLSEFMPASGFRALLGVVHNAEYTSVELASEIALQQKRGIPVRIHASIVPLYNRRLLLAFFRPQSAAASHEA